MDGSQNHHQQPLQAAQDDPLQREIINAILEKPFSSIMPFGSGLLTSLFFSFSRVEDEEKLTVFFSFSSSFQGHSRNWGDCASGGLVHPPGNGCQDH